MKRTFHKEITFEKVNTINTNITLLEINDICDSFEFIKHYKNVNGNCVKCSICDLLNIVENKNLIPTDGYSEEIDNDIFDYSYNHFTKSNKNATFAYLEKINFTGLVAIRRHMICMYKGKILNNWSNRELQTYKNFIKYDLHQKTCKIDYVLDYDKLSLLILNNKIKYEMFAKGE